MAVDEIANPTLAGTNAEQNGILANRAGNTMNRTPDADGIISGPHAQSIQQEFAVQPDAGSSTISPAEDLAAEPPAIKATSDDRSNIRINDDHFMRDLGRLKELRSFLIQEAVSIAPADAGALEFGRLNLLRRNHLAESMGRDPMEEEWNQVERLTRILFGLLTPALRRRFVLGAIPAMLAWLPLILALIALLALIMAIVSPNLDLLRMGSLGANVLPFYLIWLMSLGAIGAIAFIGMNALSVQEDITFDLTNKRLIIMRIALGALFGLVLTLPFGFEEFLGFCKTIVNGMQLPPPGKETSPAVAVQATMLVLPFILGFSTSLVILILNRFVEAVQGFFGRRTESGGGSTTAPPAQA